MILNNGLVDLGCGHFMDVEHRDIPHRQGDQGGGIHELLRVDDCDSLQWAEGEWAGGI